MLARKGKSSSWVGGRGGEIKRIGEERDDDEDEELEMEITGGQGGGEQMPSQINASNVGEKGIFMAMARTSSSVAALGRMTPDGGNGGGSGGRGGGEGGGGPGGKKIDS